MRFSVAAEAFLSHLATVRRLSPATVRAYRSDLADLVRSTSDPELADLDIERLREWQWQATTAGLSKATAARRTSSVRAFFSWARDEGLIDSDPGARSGSRTG
jgi:integrase/recombinase XerC